ncbi:MAG: flagellar protein FlgN [Verrucomicrobia bacterium]|nr:flagellar protein FlgN [Verrucomicrobiota bacterium]
MNTSSDTSHLIEALRTELEAYGTLFRLLEDQRAALLNQNADEIVEVSSSIDSHASLLNNLRKEREDQVADSPLWGGDGSRSLGQFIAQLKHESKPLLEELFGEITRLIRESKRELERNQMLYRRAWDLGQELLRSINPQADFSETYKRDGYSRHASAIQRTGYVKMA